MTKLRKFLLGSMLMVCGLVGCVEPAFAQQTRYIPKLRTDELQIDTSTVTVDTASGNTAAADCTGACTSGSICIDTDGDGSTDCDGSTECFIAFCESGAWVYKGAGGMGGGLSEVSDDITPQLGGDLDAQGNDITDVGTLTTDVHPTYDALAHGVVCDGSTDDNAALQTLIDTLVTAGTEATGGTQLFDTPSAKIQLPAGNCVLDSALEIDGSGIILEGMGKDRTFLVMREGTEALTLDAADNRTTPHNTRLGNVVLRGFTISYDNQHHTINTAPSTDTVAVYAYYVNKLIIEDVKVYFDEWNSVMGLTGMTLSRTEPGTLKEVEIHNALGTTSGNDAVCLEILNEDDNRGNLLLSNIFVRGCQVGISIYDTQLLNSVVFDNVKVLNYNGSGETPGSVARTYKYGVHVDGTTNLVFNGLHVEGEIDVSTSEYSWDACVWLENTRSAVFNAPLISRCEKGFDLDTVKGVRIFDTVVAAADNVGNTPDFDPVYDVSSDSSDVWILGGKLINPGVGTVEVVNWLDAPTASDKGNLFAWRDTGGTPTGAGGEATSNVRTPLWQDTVRVGTLGVGIGQSATVGYGTSSVTFDVDGGGAEWDFDGSCVTFPDSSTLCTSDGEGSNVRVVSTTGNDDHTTVQAAIDWIIANGSPSATNPWTIRVKDGWYEDANAQFSTAGLDYTDIACDSWGAVFYVDDGTYAGGVVQLGGASSADASTHVSLRNCRIVNVLSGGFGDGGSPPEGAVYVGAESTHPSTLHWDYIRVEGNLIEGSHDGLQIFGVSNSYSGTPPRLWVQNNVITSNHDAYTLKGFAQIESSSNQVTTDNRGVDPYLTGPNAWKTTGFHHNFAPGDNEADRSLVDGSYLNSVGDSFTVRAAATNEGGSGAGGQQYVAGILIYATNNAGAVMPMRFHGTTIRVESDNDSDQIVGGVVLMEASAAITVSSDDFEISNADIKVSQTKTTGPATVAGVWLESNNTSGSSIRVTNSHIAVSNLESGTGNAYSLYAVTAGSPVEDTIYAEGVLSDQAVGGSGSVLALANVVPGRDDGIDYDLDGTNEVESNGTNVTIDPADTGTPPWTITATALSGPDIDGSNSLQVFDNDSGSPSCASNGTAGALTLLDTNSSSSETWTLCNGTGDLMQLTEPVYSVHWEAVAIDSGGSDITRYLSSVPFASEVVGVKCIVQGSSTPDVDIDIKECASDGTSCTTMLTGLVTCDADAQSGSFSDTALASGAFVQVVVDVSSETGTVDVLDVILQLSRN